MRKIAYKLHSGIRIYVCGGFDVYKDVRANEIKLLLQVKPWPVSSGPSVEI